MRYLSTDPQRTGHDVVQEDVTAGYHTPVCTQILLAVVFLPSVAGSVVRICGELIVILFIDVAGLLVILVLPIMHDLAFV
jgi:hypothetical protein